MQMTKRKHLYLIVIGLLVVLLLLVFCTNLYFINWLTVDSSNNGRIKGGIQESERGVPLPVGPSAVIGKFNVDIRNRGLVGEDEEDDHLPVQFPSRSDVVRALVEIKVAALKPSFRNRNPRYYPMKRALIRAFETKTFNISTVWRIANSWPQANEIYPAKDERIGKVLKSLQESEITRARNTPRGTQLKLLLDLAGKQSVLFKPAWYNRDTTIEGPVYSGKDRHNSEIVAFHLGAILNLRWTPIVAGRRISLTKLYSVADEGLRETMI
ncbi:glycosaminoglycan xylosylkinase homolog, partial [Uranotaenia lowii]|uniref:glycosaminoglycan xylosylkinase homolog n=1 Tax=Uranotaenia lowii TaxID=190385 RepID=UPI002478A549